MKRIAVILLGCLGMSLLMAHAAHASCKLIINVDRTGSMLELEGSTGKTKCQLAQNSVLDILDAYWYGVDYKATGTNADTVNRLKSDVISVDYNGECACIPGVGGAAGTPCSRATGQAGPTAASLNTRLVQVREFYGNVIGPLPLWTGFKPVDEAIRFMEADAATGSGWYDPISHDSLGACPGDSTPLAAGMCTAARVFPPGGETGGTFERIKTTSDGAENSSEFFPGLTDDERCKTAGDSDTQWQDKVIAVYTARGVADTILWSSVTGFTAGSSLRESGDAARTSARGATIPGASLSATDEEFFGLLADLTGGTFELVTATTPLPPELTRVDSDGDGIPDFRDQCVGDCAADLDHDGIPDAQDACPTLAEDGHLPFRTDGCPDADVDGVQDGVDKCLGVPEDHFEPFPNDGCPSAHWSASFALKLPFRGVVCSSQLVVSPTGAASKAKLSIAGSHSSRAGLRGVLFHNIEPSVAFPVGTFPAGPGAFSFTDRPIDVSPGSATGLWTFCIIDSKGFGDSGVLNSWSIHD